MRRVLLDGTRWVLYIVLPIHLGLLFFGRPFLARWVGGPQYADWCYPATAILSAARNMPSVLKSMTMSPFGPTAMMPPLPPRAGTRE